LEEEELERGWDRLGLVGIGYRELYRWCQFQMHYWI